MSGHNLTAAYSSTFDIRGMTRTFHQEHLDAALARTLVPPELVDITHPWKWAPPKLIDKRRHYCSIKPAQRIVTAGQTPVTDTATGGVRVMADRCGRCHFRPGNEGNLAPGQLARLVRECVAEEGHIVCRLPRDRGGQRPARRVCAGFAAHPDAGRSLALRIAATGRMLPQDPSAD